MNDDVKGRVSEVIRLKGWMTFTEASTHLGFSRYGVHKLVFARGASSPFDWRTEVRGVGDRPLLVLREDAVLRVARDTKLNVVRGQSKIGKADAAVEGARVDEVIRLKGWMTFAEASKHLGYSVPGVHTLVFKRGPGGSPCPFDFATEVRGIGDRPLLVLREDAVLRVARDTNPNTVRGQSKIRKASKTDEL